MMQIRECLIELQDAERDLDPRMPAGADIVAAYIPQMLERCDTCEGKIFVAEAADGVVGYVTILTRVSSEELAAGDFEYGLVADLVVRGKYRNFGLGRKLLEAAESYAREHGVKWLRIGALAGNHAARQLYSSSGFSQLYVEVEKDLTAC